MTRTTTLPTSFVVVLFALALVACGRGDRCPDASGTYAATVVELSGTCGPMEPFVGDLVWGGFPSIDCEGTRSVSKDGCDLDIDQTCEHVQTDGTSLFIRLDGTLSQIRDDAGLVEIAGNVVVRVRDERGVVLCESEYALRYEPI